MKKVSMMKVDFAAFVGEGQTITDAHRETAARLLRHAAEMIERGDDLGGFHFGPDDHNDGGFSLHPEETTIR